MLLALGTGDRDQCDVRHRLDARRGRDHTLRRLPTFWRTWWLGDSAGALVAFRS